MIYKDNDDYYLMASTNQWQPARSRGHLGRRQSGHLRTVVLAVNTWTHLAVTYDGATVRLYVNGVQVASQARHGARHLDRNPLQIGGDSYLRASTFRAHRRGAHLQPRAERRPRSRPT